MKIIAVKAVNFLSFRELEFIIPDAGLIFVGGEVVNGAMSSSNGAGKSALFEALAWGLFGKTIRSVKSKDDVMNLDAGMDCVVEVVFEGEEGHVYRVTRYRGLKGRAGLKFEFQDATTHDLTGQNVDVTQAAIEQVLGLSWPVFSTVVVFGEKAQRFIEATDSEKKAIFDEILQFHQYLAALDKVKIDLQKLDTEKTKANIAIDVNTDGLRKAQVEIEVAQKAEDDLKFEREKAREHGLEVEAQIGKLEADIIETATAIEAAKKVQDEMAKSAIDLQTVMHELDVTRVKTEGDFRTRSSLLGTAKRRLDDDIVKLNQKMSNAGHLQTDARCPTCGQKVTAESVSHIIHEYQSEVQTLEEQKVQIAKDTAALSADFESAIKPIDDQRKEYSQVRVEVDTELQKARRAILTLEPTLISYNSQVQNLRFQQTQDDERFKQRETILANNRMLKQKWVIDLETEIKKQNYVIAQLEVQRPYLEFWKDGFGNQGIKSFLLDEIVPALNNRMDYYASTLMGGELAVRFDTESVLKSGETRDKISIHIERHGNVVDYALLSAGEKRRVDVAILLALQSLVFERHAKNTNLMVLDEVFDSLDRVGIEKAVNLLVEEAKNKAIYVISHLSEFRDYFDSEIIVRKTGGISELVHG